MQEYDPDYLEALFTHNVLVIRQKEEEAMLGGYGPLAPCSREVTGREKRQTCSMSPTLFSFV